MRITDRSNGFCRAYGVVMTISLILTCFVNTAQAGRKDCEATVHAGESIQAAIDRARPGDRIVIETGTYAQQITISKDGISLIGRGAVLVPPEHPVQNQCTGLVGKVTAAGICVIGTGVALGDFVQQHRDVLSVAKRVRGVTITGMQVVGFDGVDIAVVGAQDTQVKGNWLHEAGLYGFLATGSLNTRVFDNAMSATGPLRFIGLCTDDMSPAKVSKNHVSGFYIGLCIQTTGSEFEYNDISGCCTGAFVDPYVAGVTFHHNHIGASDTRCFAEWPFNAGMIIDGAINTKVQFNLIEGQHANGTAAGLAIGDDPTFTPAVVASGNVVTKNIFRDNDIDLFVNTTGTGNVATGNKCTTSFPPELCAKK